MSHNGGALTLTSDSPEYLEFVRNRLSHVDALLRTPRSALYIEGLLDAVQNLVADSSPNTIRNTKNLNLFLQRYERLTADFKEFRCVLPSAYAFCVTAYVLVLVRICSSRLLPPLASSPSASASGVHSPQRVLKITLLAYCFCSYNKACSCLCCVSVAVALGTCAHCSLACVQIHFPELLSCSCFQPIMLYLCKRCCSRVPRAASVLVLIAASASASATVVLFTLRPRSRAVQLITHVSASATRM